MTPEQLLTLTIVIGIAQVLTALAVLISDIILAVQVNRLRIVVQDTRQDFDRVKHDIGSIKNGVGQYREIIEGIARNGVNLKLRSERFGALELDLKKQEDKK